MPPLHKARYVDIRTEPVPAFLRYLAGAGWTSVLEGGDVSSPRMSTSQQWLRAASSIGAQIAQQSPKKRQHLDALDPYTPAVA
jgi:hypothetical protein